MLAIEIEFLMGRAVATQISERTQAEWPPHPQRLFSALVAANAELELGAAGEAALKWLETLPPPEVCADLDPSYRHVHSHFVPVNDETIRGEAGKADFRHPIERRNRQERFFPAIVPRDPIVIFQWPMAPGLEVHRSSMRTLVENLSYVGHSSSPVRACLRDKVAEATLRPAADGEFAMRVPGPGRFQRLEAVHRLRIEDESVQPPVGRVAAYAAAASTARSSFSPQAMVVAFKDGPRLALDSTLPLLQHLRNALLSRLGNRAAEVLSGHREDGRPSAEAHLALVPLAFVDRRFADGGMKGVALVLPRNCESAARRELSKALIEPWQLHLGPLGSIVVQLVEDLSHELASLNFTRYSRLAAQWASVTPVVLDHFPKKGSTAETIIAQSCERIGLPRPVEVRTGPVAAIRGVPPVRDFHGKAKQVDGRVRHHVLLRFAEPVCGPILLGAGRFIGLGAFLPYREGANSE